MKIDTSEWKPFKIGGEYGLFNVVKGKRLTKKKLKKTRTKKRKSVTPMLPKTRS